MLNGKNATEMCEINAEVALQQNIPQASLVWEISKLYCQIQTETDEEPPTPVVLKKLDPTTVSSLATPPNYNNNKDHHDHNKGGGGERDHDHHLSDDDANNNSSSETEKQDILAQIASGLHMNQTLFMPSGPTYEFNYDMQPVSSTFLVFM